MSGPDGWIYVGLMPVIPFTWLVPYAGYVAGQYVSLLSSYVVSVLFDDSDPYWGALSSIITTSPPVVYVLAFLVVVWLNSCRVHQEKNRERIGTKKKK